MLILLFGGTHKFQGVYKGGLATQMIKKIFFVPSFCHRIAYFKGDFISSIQNFSFIPPVLLLVFKSSSVLESIQTK